MTSVDYRVKLDAFEGPLDLLLHLVKTNEVDIYHLPIATITDQYLGYIDMFQELNLDVAGEYLVMAATLMYLKSRLLLPADEELDEEDAEDPAVDLVRQLAEYQRYREAAEELRDRALLGRDVFSRDPFPPDAAERDDPEVKQLDLPVLFEALRRVLSTAAARHPHEVESEQFSVGDAVRQMVDKMRMKERSSFTELFQPGSPRGLIIATFIGLLELMRMHVIHAEQDETHGEIYLRLIDAEVDDTKLALVETYGQDAWSERPAAVNGHDESAVAADVAPPGGESGDNGQTPGGPEGQP